MDPIHRILVEDVPDRVLCRAQRELLAVIEAAQPACKLEACWDELFAITEELNRRRAPSQEAA